MLLLACSLPSLFLYVPIIGTTQWLPYWTNGNVPLVALIRAANATAKLNTDLNLADVIDTWMAYVLAHTNKTNGWIGPYTNEPGDNNGHGLWDPLNMIRSLLMHMEAQPRFAKQVTKATVAHLTQEYKLLTTDPVIKWAQTRYKVKFVQEKIHTVYKRQR